MARKSSAATQVRGIPRGVRQEGTRFGRSQLGVPGGDLTDFGCPDCRGVLAVRDEGKQGYLAFSCRVGHVFSGETLIAAKEEQVEDALWCLVELYEEVVILHEELHDRARRRGLTAVAGGYRRRAERARAAVSALRALNEEDTPASPQRERG
jgi:two-component system, chemotaxis family, protein-glutamate methylesterase/glutaminase